MRRTLSIVLDLTERCNLKCVMCYFSAVDRLRFAPFDRSLSERGNMPVEVFEKIAADLFPRAWRVALGCAAEPLVHPAFRDVLAIAGRYRVPDLWFPTNLLALTDKTAAAIVDAGVTTVAASIDGVTRETYEKIRVGGSWDRLLSRLDLLNEVRRRRRRPRLRVIFTWMRSNRHELRALPAFAAAHGAGELDVRFVTRTTGVDVGPELLDGEDPEALRADLRAVAEEAVARGMRLTSYPEFETAAERPRSLAGRWRRRVFRLRAGLERGEHWRHLWRERRNGCAYPGETYVIRPNGAVFPCIFWEQEPIGFYPEDDLAAIAGGRALARIRDGLVCGRPVGSCSQCGQRRDAFYRPFRRLLAGPEASPAAASAQAEDDVEAAAMGAEPTYNQLSPG
jgi:MoaA/NifB/PqqE/SkfB family radical SAM enzyme